MEEHGNCMSGVCPRARGNGEPVSLYVPYHHPFLQLQRALPWEARTEVMTRPWRRASKNVDGPPGLAWDSALSGPLVVWMVVKPLQARAMEASLAANVVARGFIGRQAAPRPPMRDHANSARAYAALGKDGLEEGNALRLHVAKAYGFAEARLLSSDTTAQAWPMGYPNDPGIIRGGAQRWGRALTQLKTRAVMGVDTALAHVQTILRTVKAQHLFGKSRAAQRPGLTRLLTAGGPLVAQTRLRGTGLGERRDRVPHNAIPTLKTLHEVAKQLLPQIVQWITPGVGAKGQSVHAGVTPARAIVRHKAGKDVELGLPSLLRRLGGGDVFGPVSRGGVDEAKRPLQALATSRESFGAQATLALMGYDRGARPRRP